MTDGVIGPKQGGSSYVIDDTKVLQKDSEVVVGAGNAGQGKGQVDGVPLKKNTTDANASKPELPGVQTDKVDWTKMDSQSILAILGLEQNKRGAERSESDVKVNLAQQQKTAETRLKQIEEATKKAEEAKAKENSFWSKFLKVLSKVGSVLGSIATIAMSVALMATGPVGAVVGGLLMAHALSSLANTVMETLIETGAIDDPGWRPTIASGVAKFAEKVCGADPKTAAWIGLGFEIAVVLTLNVAAAGVVLKEAGKVADSFMKGADILGKEVAGQLAKEASKGVIKDLMGGTAFKVAGYGAQATKAVSQIGSGVIAGQVADLQFESDAATARAEEMKAAMARLAKMIQMDMETVETLIKRMQSNTETVAEIVQGTSESNKSIAMNMGGGTAAA
jgi:hypothetical protein